MRHQIQETYWCTRSDAPHRQDRGQVGFLINHVIIVAGRKHSTKLLDEAVEAAGLKSRRRLEQLLQERSKIRGRGISRETRSSKFREIDRPHIYFVYTEAVLGVN